MARHSAGSGKRAALRRLRLGDKQTMRQVSGSTGTRARIFRGRPGDLDLCLQFPESKNGNGLESARFHGVSQSNRSWIKLAWRRAFALASSAELALDSATMQSLEKLDSAGNQVAADVPESSAYESMNKTRDFAKAEQLLQHLMRPST